MEDMIIVYNIVAIFWDAFYGTLYTVFNFRNYLCLQGEIKSFSFVWTVQSPYRMCFYLRYCNGLTVALTTFVNIRKRIRINASSFSGESKDFKGYILLSKTIKARLIRKYSSEIIVTKDKTKIQVILCFRNTCYIIFNEKWYQESRITDDLQR